MLPEKWDELSGRQLLAYCKLIDQPETNAYNIALAFLNPDKQILFRLNRAQTDAIARNLEWLWTEECTITTFPVNHFWHRGIKYYSPGANLKNTTVEEMAIADNYLRMFVERQEDHWLNCLVATLYRHTNPYRWIKHLYRKDDIRVPLNSRVIDSAGKRLASLPLHVKKAVMYSFLGVRNDTRIRYPFLYQHRDKNNLGWSATIISLAGPELGTIDDVGAMLWNNALMFMVHNEVRRSAITQPVNKHEQQHDHDTNGNHLE